MASCAWKLDSYASEVSHFLLKIELQKSTEIRFLRAKRATFVENGISKSTEIRILLAKRATFTENSNTKSLKK